MNQCYRCTAVTQAGEKKEKVPFSLLSVGTMADYVNGIV
jgi:hypothetical protein